MNIKMNVKHNAVYGCLWYILQHVHTYPAVFWINGIRSAGKQIAITKQSSRKYVKRNSNSVVAQREISHTVAALVANGNVFASAFKWRSVTDLPRHENESVMRNHGEVRMNNHISTFDFQRKVYVRHISCKKKINLTCTAEKYDCK